MGDKAPVLFSFLFGTVVLEVITMFSKQFISTKQIFRAAALGMVIGLAGVGAFALFLITAKDSGETPEATEEKETVEVNATPQQVARFYASQYGAFTTFDSASAFLAQYPALNKAVVIQVADTFYVWSKITLSKLSEETVPASFSKSFQFSSNSCPKNSIADIPLYLQDENKLKNNFQAASEDDKLPEEWTSFMEGITGLSNDVNVLRLHALAQFYGEHDCLKIDFDA